MLQNASPLEAGWTLAALVGVVASSSLLWIYVTLERRRRSAGVGGALAHDIHKSISSAAGKTVVSVCFLITGLIAMQTPPSPLIQSDAQVAAGAIAIPVLFIVANIATTASAVYGLFQHELTERDLLGAVRRNRRFKDVHNTVDEYTDAGGDGGEA